MFIVNYIKDIFGGVKSLFTGMKMTGWYALHHGKEKITQQYPDNKDTLELPERFRGEVVMIHDEHNEHACTGCTACELACPNATIKIVTKFDIQADGKKKKAIDKFVYHLELCTFCNLCIEACPTNAIKMAQTFEHSTFDRTELTKILNNPGSKIREGVE
jgi:NADH-quinone oxidoreductase subunit I